MKTKKYTKILLLITAFGILTSCARKTDWDLYALEGKVKTYMESYYEPEMKFGEWVKGKPEKFRNYSVDFNTDGIYTGMDFLDDNNELRERLIAKSENGKLQEELRYGKDGEYIGETKFNYMSDSKLEFTSYDKNGEIIAQGTSFLENDKVIRRDYKVIDDGKVSFEFRMQFEYNEKGDIKSMREETEDGEVKKYAHKYLEFDDQNNWIKRLDYVDDISETPDKIIIRSYEYYK